MYVTNKNYSVNRGKNISARHLDRTSVYVCARVKSEIIVMNYTPALINKNMLTFPL